MGTIEDIEQTIVELQTKIAAAAQSTLTNKTAITATYKKIIRKSRLCSILIKTKPEEKNSVLTQFENLQSYEQIKEFINTPRTQLTIRETGFQEGQIISINGITQTVTRTMLED